MHRTLSEYTLIIANEFQYIELFDSKDISIIVLTPCTEDERPCAKGIQHGIGSTDSCIPITVICQNRNTVHKGGVFILM